jgi:hypothetical protein
MGVNNMFDYEAHKRLVDNVAVRHTYIMRDLQHLNKDNNDRLGCINVNARVGQRIDVIC